MNLHGIVSGAIGTINPFIPCMVQISVGYNQAPDYSQVPRYETFYSVPVQVQAAQGSDLMLLDGLNIQGTYRVAYLNGNYEGLNREAQKGGDIITIPDLPGFQGPTKWLVTKVIEWWPDWCKVFIVLQNPRA